MSNHTFNHATKQTSAVFLAYLLILSLSCLNSNALAHGDGDHDHDEAPKKTKSIVNLPSKAPTTVVTPKIVQAPQMLEQPKTIVPIHTTANATANSTLVLNAKATLSPSSMRYVYSPIDGLMTIKKTIHIGDFVKKGQLLGTVVNVLQPLEKNNQQQQIQILQGQLKQESQTLKRLNLVPDLVAKKEIETTQLNIQNLQQQIMHAKKPLQQTKSIYSPISGFVVSSMLDATKQVDSKQIVLGIASKQIANEVHANYFINHQQNIKANGTINAQILNMPNITLKYLGYLPQANNGVVLRFAIPEHLVESAGLWVNQALQVHVHSGLSK